ncbi:hypothetical protein MMSR116_18080 [Methylobacterium mesophilicum SR1.6/6]|uniref:Uncharacterized protein n=1 Tax=Methylobacterium mesophilicum SR1.6/6 TaxID=908290 RepID=A0A6B9FRF5_9HYPH|nr:hypothetical protein [Methylobacterium mesophilicum]QGY03584.1 hypothetical protein MMSR116_18080 [Methylobacterium mesophilicum SR1.6/6]
MSGKSGKSVGCSDLEDAADALLRIVVTGERQRSAVANPDWQKGRPWTDTLAPASTDALDVAGLATDPIGTACRAELRRIGHALHAANPDEDLAALGVEIAEMDPTHAGWRAIVLEMAWHGIGGHTLSGLPAER